MKVLSKLVIGISMHPSHNEFLSPTLLPIFKPKLAIMPWHRIIAKNTKLPSAVLRVGFSLVL